MTGKGCIFLIQDDGNLVEMREALYDSEDLLQRLLERHPNLLAGDQMDSEAPRRWLLIAREAAVPAELEGTARWSVDHLFVDQDGIPTFIEVKRSTDTRIRREVVGQMLDYAANGVAYWPADNLETQFSRTCEGRTVDPDEELASFLGDDVDARGFWDRVRENLKDRRIRMVFVADTIPAELRRVVEFLNEQMNPAEVLAVEIRQFIGERVRTLVPRVIGQTTAAIDLKRRAWDEGSFLSELDRNAGEALVAVTRQLIAWANDRADGVVYGSGAAKGTMIPDVAQGAVRFRPISVYTNGKVELKFSHMMAKNPPFDEKPSRIELLHRVNGILAVPIAEDRVDYWPRFPLAELADPGNLERFLAVLDWAIREVRSRPV
jgi:hypothetical protein